MKYILLAAALLLSACDKPPTPKIAAPQREALEKAKGVDQAVQKMPKNRSRKSRTRRGRGTARPHHTCGQDARAPKPSIISRTLIEQQF